MGREVHCKCPPQDIIIINSKLDGWKNIIIVQSYLYSVEISTNTAVWDDIIVRLYENSIVVVNNVEATGIYDEI